MTKTAAEIPALAGELEETPRTYWQIVFRSYRRQWRNVIAFGFIALIGLVAVFVPFIANGLPYTCIVDGERRYPLFRSLTNVDLMVLCAGIMAIIYAFYLFFTRKRTDLEKRIAQRRRVALCFFGFTVGFGCALLLFKTDYNDLMHREDYMMITPDYEVKDAIWPPVTWGYKSQVYPLLSEKPFADPSWAHPLGLDSGRHDALSRLLWSSRIVFSIGIISQGISLLIGIIYGSLMGYFGGKTDMLGMRFVEIVESFPVIFLILIFVSVFGQQIYMIMVIIGITSWTGIARFVRAEFLRLRKLDYVAAARASGLPVHSILFRHILPNGLTPVLVNATFGVAGAVTIESGLSFLGLGVEPPTPSWGIMLKEATDPSQDFHFWLAFFPGLMIFLTIFAYNIIGEGLRDAIDPRMRK